jgi:alkylation response protein AidB-like acyl-CoA dehydrogenase
VTSGGERDSIQLRERIRRFVAEHPPPELRGVGRRRRITGLRDWSATMYDNGFAGPAWPRKYGGMDLSFADQVEYHDEFAKLDVPPHPGNGPSIAGPTLLKYGTEQQKSRYLPAMLRADQVWAQGFSEPDAGSDLPSLTTTAVRDGNQYVVTGVKLWSTFADVAEMMFALVRTGPPGSGRHGISYLLIDMRSDGVSVRPLRDMSGQSRFCQVFFDEVRVPVTDRVGAENQGWPLARTTLGNERAARSLSQASAYRRRMDTLIDLLRSRHALDDPIARDKLARCETHVRILGFNAIRSTATLMVHGSPGPTASISRLYHSRLEQEFNELAVDLLGQDGLQTGGAESIGNGRWVTGYLHSRGATIGAGTAEVQRNTIAEQILGLPRDDSAARVADGSGRPY